MADTSAPPSPAPSDTFSFTYSASDPTGAVAPSNGHLGNGARVVNPKKGDPSCPEGQGQVGQRSRNVVPKRGGSRAPPPVTGPRAKNPPRKAAGRIAFDTPERDVVPAKPHPRRWQKPVQTVPTNQEDDGGEEIDIDEEEYTPPKVVEKPKQHRQCRTKGDSQKDLLSIYEPGMEDGHEGVFCTLCRVEGELKYFFTGTSSSLRKHVHTKQKTHLQPYVDYCIKNNLPVDGRADQENASYIEHCLGRVEQCDSEGEDILAWSKDNLLDHIVELIVSDDQAFQLVDQAVFRSLLNFQRPNMPANSIPHRTQVTEAIKRKADDAGSILRKKLADAPGQISVTWDGWTSDSNNPYLATTSHWIDGTPNDPTEWKLYSRLIGFDEIEGNHSGANSAKIFMGVIDRYGIRAKLGFGTGDNVTVNDTTLQFVQKYIEHGGQRTWNSRERRGRCIGHSIHLCAKHFALEVQPKKVTRKRQRGTAQPGPAAKQTCTDASSSRNTVVQDPDFDTAADDDVSEDEAEDDDGWDAAPVQPGLSIQMVDGVADGPAPAVHFDAGDVLGKVLAMITQIRASPQAMAFLRAKCKQEGEPDLALLTFVRTRWTGLHDTLGRVLQLQKAITTFLSIADHAPEVPRLQRGRKYRDFELTPKEWDLIQVIHEALAVPAHAQSRFSSESETTMWRAFPVLNFLIQKWTEFSKNPRFKLVKAALLKGVANLKKWYFLIGETPIYFICHFLHPRYKHHFLEALLAADRQSGVYVNGMVTVKRIFQEYKMELEGLQPVQPPVAQEPPGNLFISYVESPVKPRDYESYMDRIMLPYRQRVEPAADPFKELNEYMAENCDVTPDLDIVRWWGKNSQRYPILSRIARDYLAIQGSSVASERSFSSAGLTDDKQRNSLGTKLFGDLQVLKSCYAAGDMH